MSRLTEIANACGTDKGTTFRQAHGYTLIYECLFSSVRDHPLNLLEVGLSIGGPELIGGSIDRNIEDAPSVRMWRQFFRSAHIFGVDISDFSQFENEWFTFYQADCGEEAHLDRVARCGERFDIIIDDGSHASYHQQLTLLKLFPLLKPGGFYIIEDLNWQPRHYERSLPSVPKTANIMSQLLKNGEIKEVGALSQERWSEVLNRVANVLVFDEDTLLSGRRFYNLRHGKKPKYPTFLERPYPQRMLMRGYVRRALEDAWTLIGTLCGRVEGVKAPRAKLAILQKG